MKGFVVKIAGFSLIIIGIFVVFSFLPTSDNYLGNNYYFGHIIKLKHLEQTQNNTAKRIVFVGGSSLAFGINSKEIADSLGVEVYNSTIHGGLGVDYTLQEIIPRLNPKKDIVVLGYEFDFIEDPHFYTDARIIVDYLQKRSLFKQLVFNPKPLRTTLMYAKVIFTNFLYMLQPGKKGYDEIYRADGFDTNGDLTSHLSLPDMGGKPLRIEADSPSEEYVRLVEKKLAGFDYYLISPPVYEKDLENYPDEYKTFDNFMTSHFGKKYLVKAQDSGIEKSGYFEFPLHLNKTGREEHTQRIIRAMRCEM